jgi:hypothetical protein
MNMDDIPNILRNHTVRVEAQDQWGSGILWKSPAEAGVFIFTCKHNLCSHKPKCKIQCGNNCGELADANQIRVSGSEVSYEIAGKFVSEDKDFAVLALANTTMHRNFINEIMVYSIDNVGFYKRAFFKGHPNVLSEIGDESNSHLFDGYIADIEAKNHKLTIKDLSISDINDIRGVSGSGVFCKGTNGNIGLVGIITNYIGALSSFYAFNPYHALCTEFLLDITDAKGKVSDKSKSIWELEQNFIQKDIENLVELIKMIDAQIRLSFEPDTLKKKKEAYLLELRQKINDLDELTD